MIIKRVKLENYRSHSNTTVDFSKGVNLILGKNGKGKTSILEAISSVMFNTKDRSGKETGKNFIKFGEKSGKIEIEFTANDGRDYILKTEFFKTKPKRQTLKDLNGIDCEEDIQEKLEELCGIKKGFEETYENIVIAKQNEFINIFKAKPKDREEILVISIGIKNNEYINLENLENIAENNGALKTHILIKNILSIGNSEEGTSDLSIEELEKNLISDWNISNIEKFSASFSELKELFSNNDRDSFLELFDKTLEVNEDDN